MLIIMIAVFIIIFGAIVTTGWHLLLPKEYHWLEEEALSQVRSAVLSGAAVGLGMNYLRRYMGRDRP